MTLPSTKWERIGLFFVKDFRVVGWIYVIIVIGTTALQYFPDPQLFGDMLVTHYNNFIIFKQSFYHLVAAKDLYAFYWDEYYDLFKYSPTFPILFAPLAILPDFAGLLLWNTLNAGLLFVAVRMLPVKNNTTKIIVLLFIIPELVTAIQNSQSNALMAALIILSFNFFEKDKLLLAALCLTLGLFVKLFAIVGASLFLFYPGKPRFVIYLICWCTLFLVLPLVVISPEQLGEQYQHWRAILTVDHNSLTEYSIMSWLKTWVGISWPKIWIVGVGALIFCMPFLKLKSFGDQNFRLLFLSSILIWVVIFNHNAESPTFVIAMSGVGLWFFSGEKTILNTVLVMLAFIFTSMSPMGIFPKWFYDQLVDPYVLKGAFCVVVWFKILSDLMQYRATSSSGDNHFTIV